MLYTLVVVPAARVRPELGSVFVRGSGVAEFPEALGFSGRVRSGPFAGRPRLFCGRDAWGHGKRTPQLKGMLITG